MSLIGRPKGKNNKEIVRTIRIDENTARRLEIYCRKISIGRSQAIRDAIDLLISEVENDEEAKMIIPGLFEPPVRTLRATIPENESHIFR